MGWCYLHTAIATRSGDIKRFQLDDDFLKSRFDAGYEKIIFVEDMGGLSFRGALSANRTVGLPAAEVIGRYILANRILPFTAAVSPDYVQKVEYIGVLDGNCDEVKELTMTERGLQSAERDARISSRLQSHSEVQAYLCGAAGQLGYDGGTAPRVSFQVAWKQADNRVLELVQEFAQDPDHFVVALSDDFDALGNGTGYGQNVAMVIGPRLSDVDGAPRLIWGNHYDIDAMVARAGIMPELFSLACSLVGWGWILPHKRASLPHYGEVATTFPELMW